MNTLNLEITNPEPILKDLENHFLKAADSNLLYLTKPWADDYENPLNLINRTNAFGITELLLPEILHLLGIRSLLLSQAYDLNHLVELGNQIVDDADWNEASLLENQPLIEAHRSIFATCRTIAFDDWAGFDRAATLWPWFLENILAPINNKNLEFVFYVGNPIHKSSWQVEQALHIISGFSEFGSVTLALDEDEALNLWRVLNGVGEEVVFESETIVDRKKKYFSLYKSIAVNRLLIYSTNNVILFSVDEQIVLSRKTVATKVELGINARQNFISGFSTGLILQMGIKHSIALGLITFGAGGQFRGALALEAIRNYIARWISDLEKPDSIFLYQ